VILNDKSHTSPVLTSPCLSKGEEYLGIKVSPSERFREVKKKFSVDCEYGNGVVSFL
jgi:hypothetical protein